MSKSVTKAEKKDFGMIDKLAYASGDFGCLMSFSLKSYLTIYWTQYMGINSYVMSGLLLLVQVWDAINDPLIGAIVDADQHQYKRNKFITYIWVGSIGLVVGGALCFLPFPNAPSMVKNVLFVVGYIFWDAFYTIANVPYGSMLSLITEDPQERAQLSTFRSVGSMAGGMLTGVLIPLIIYDSDSNLRGGKMFFIAIILGLVGFVFFQFMIRNTKVRVDTSVRVSEDTPKFNVFGAIKNFVRNRALVGASIAAMGMYIGMYGASTASTIMFQAYFNAAQISGLVSMVAYVGVFIFVPFVNPIVGRFGKKEAVVAGYGLCCLAYILMLILPITPDAKGLAMYVACQFINALGSGVGSCLTWGMVADATDYNEWKFGERDEGTTYALYSFFRKLAQGIGPSVGLALATYLGYEAALGAAQTAEVALTMRYLVAVMYLFAAAVQFLSFAFIYNLDKKTMAQVTSDLNERHAAAKAKAEAKQSE